MSRVVIEHLDIVVTVDASDTVLRDVTITVEDGVIAEIAPGGEERGAHAAGRRARDTRVIDGRGKLALPGLVNLHTHLPMTLLRGLAERVDLQGFLERVWAAEAAVMDPPTVELGAALGALESLLGGCTTQLDMYFHPELAHRGAVAVGARHVGGPVFFDSPGPDGLSWEERLDLLRLWPEVVARLGGPEVPTAAMPHATYTVEPGHLREVREVLLEVGGPRTVLHTHLSENAAENADVQSRYGVSPSVLLGRAGWFADPEREQRGCHVVLGHGVYLTAADRVALAERGVSVAHCPGSNLKLASGALAWEQWRADGVLVGIGTDGCASSNDLDMWQAMRQAALLARLTSGHPDAAPPEQILRAATIDGARALGMDDLIGSLEVGKRADIVLLDLERPHLTPVHDVAALLVFSAGRGDVHTVIVDGDIVVDARASTRVDEPTLLRHARERGAAAAAAVAQVAADHVLGAQPVDGESTLAEPVDAPGDEPVDDPLGEGEPHDEHEQEGTPASVTALRMPRRPIARDIIDEFGMQPIPGEGGWFTPGPRSQELSSILLLLTDAPYGFSAMHRLDIDEGWQWIDGDPVALLRLRGHGTGVLNLMRREHSQFLVRRGTWMGAATLGSWSLLACWCTPAFRPQHFHLGDRDELCAQYPHFTDAITALTRGEG